MKQEAIHDYLENYFETCGCDIIHNRPGYLNVKLTVELDKLLMNRPFYWHYVEKLGHPGETKTLAFKTTPSDEEGELIHFGSPRLHQIFKSARELSPYIRLFQEVEPEDRQQTPLYSWIGINAKISYCSDLKRDYILSLGLNLTNGTIIKDFHDCLEQLALTPKIPDYCYTLSPIIKPMSGLNRLEKIIENVIADEDHTWSEEALERWENDIELLERFYDEQQEEELPDFYEKEKEAMKEQYEPHIDVNIINGGLFYLTQGAIGV